MKTLPSLRCWTEIDLAALAFNVKRIRSLLPKSCQIIGVVKADAYGHGLFSIARALAKLQVRVLAVANTAEAEIASRASPQADILLLSPLLPEEISDLVRHSRWIPILSNQEEFMALEAEAMRHNRKIRVQVKLDTGMGRLGGFAKEILPLLGKIKGSRWIQLNGIFSHFASADLHKKASMEQAMEFMAFCRQALREGFRIPQLHLQNSAGIICFPIASDFQYARPGLALYGAPHPIQLWKKNFGIHPLRPVLSWKTRVALVRDLPKGASISYARTYRTSVRTRIAVLAAGYADGISRKLSNRGEILLHGRRCRILGRVTMDMIMVDVTRVSSVHWGDVATLIGKNGKDEITVAEMAAWAETNAYEVFCNIGKRVPRLPLSPN